MPPTLPCLSLSRTALAFCLFLCLQRHPILSIAWAWDGLLFPICPISYKTTMERSHSAFAGIHKVSQIATYALHFITFAQKIPKSQPTTPPCSVCSFHDRLHEEGMSSYVKIQRAHFACFSALWTWEYGCGVCIASAPVYAKVHLAK